MKILITGITGFIGSRVAKLLSAEHQVTGLIRNSSNLSPLKSFENLIHLFNIEKCSFDEIFHQEYDVIVHLAVEYGRKNPLSKVIDTNINLPIKLIEYGSKNGLKAFINTDSFNTKNRNYTYLRSYTLSKFQIKEWLETYSNQLKIFNLRLEHVYGTNDSENKFIPSIIQRIKSNEQVIALTEGLQRRDFIYLDDVANAFNCIVNNTNHFKNGFYHFDVGTGISTSIKEVVEIIHSICKSKSKLNFGALPYRKTEFDETKANIKNLQKLGWKPNILLHEGLKKCIHSIQT